MTTANPYSPPQAEVADARPAQYSQPRVWSYRGRIGRLRYLAYSMGGYLVLLAVLAVVAGVAALVSSPGLAEVAVWLPVLGYGVLVVLAGIQRSHDMGWSGWTVLLSFIPLVNLIWLFKGGSAGDNRFGAPPPPNTLGIKLLAFIPAVLLVVGIVAAIALPAYQGYLIRAQEARGAPA